MLSDFSIQMDRVIETRRPDFVRSRQRERKGQGIDFTLPKNVNVSRKVLRK